MKLKNHTALYTLFALLTVLFISSSIRAQDNDPIRRLEGLHKQALESGDEQTAQTIRGELLKSYGSGVILTKSNSDGLMPIEKSEEGDETAGDWLASDNQIYSGQVNPASSYRRHLDLKAGEDNNLYAAVSVGPTEYSNGNIKVYRSSDNGKTWNRILNLASFSYFSTISLLVESRANSIGDSTRILVFYTSSNQPDFQNATLNYASIRRDGTGLYAGTIATPSSGNQFSSVSAISDGAFYSNATYVGVVCTEVNNSNNYSQNIRYYRSIDWGATWTTATLTTGFSDFNPSAAYKYSGDSVYIAAERTISYSNRQIVLLATRFTPTANFSTRYISLGNGIIMERPCLNIKQNNPVDSMMIIYKKDDNAFYSYSTNAGNSWSSESQLTNSGTVNSVYCSSSISGSKPFTMCWSLYSPGTINVRRGGLGAFDVVYDNINNFGSVSGWVDIPCLTVPVSGNNYSAVMYAGYGPQDAFFDIESNKQLNISAVPQGMYNPVTNQLTRPDTLKIYLRTASSPYSVVDSAMAYIDNYTLSSSLYFTRAANQNYYIDIRNKNTIAVWSYWQNGINTIDLLRFQYTAYGNNTVSINNVLGYFGLYSGDVNQDGIIDGTDTQLIDNDANAFVSGYSIQDLNGDSFVDGTDALIAGNNAFNFISVITPP